MLIYVIAGEPSGDLLGGRLMESLRRETGDCVQFAGIGGENMQAQGLRSLFPMTELTVMGLTEVLPRIPRILRRVRETLDDIGRLRPDAVVTIDSWGFTGRVQKGCQKRYPDLPRIHYVAPMVWAWKPKRAAKLAKVLDLLMTLLPFEPPYFEREGLRTVHVGHPVVESGAGQGNGAAFRARHGIADDVKLLTVLPGSRHSETSKLLPVFGQVLEQLKSCPGQIRVVVPTLPHLADEVRQAARGWPFEPLVLTDSSQKYDCFAASTCALAASGTVALELAMAGLPTVIAYRLSALTAFLARNLFGFKIKWATLVNMVLDRPVMPEFLQEECRADRITPVLVRMLTDESERDWRRHDMAAGMVALGLGGESPGKRAAQVVLNYIAQRKQP
ncbi:MAG: lipid-A-disaccharide synthase [Magnetospirillum gryphiswaldense]|nr:lipid-A-disaccharide synthase [Magnetospirillum gryphiswaldense]